MIFDLQEEILRITRCHAALNGIDMKMPCGNTAALSKYEHAQALADRAPVELPDFSQEDWAHDAFGPKQAKSIAELFTLRDEYLNKPISEDVRRFMVALAKLEKVAYAEVMDK